MSKREYEIMLIVRPKATADQISEIKEIFEKILVDQGAAIVKSEDWGMRKLAYKIKKESEGYYLLFFVEGTGKELAELERRLRVSDYILRYLTVRVDEEKKASVKILAKRANRQAKRNKLSTKPTETDNSSEDAQDE